MSSSMPRTWCLRLCVFACVLSCLNVCVAGVDRPDAESMVSTAHNTYGGGIVKYAKERMRHAMTGLDGSLSARIRAESNHMHALVFGIKLRNIDYIESHVLDISNPSSGNYGAYLSREEVGQLTSNREAVSTLENFLSGFPEVQFVSKTLYGEFLTYKAPIHVWERMLEAEFYHVEKEKFRNKKRVRGDQSRSELLEPKEMITRTQQYTMPAALVGHVQVIFNTIQVPMFHLEPSVERPLTSRRQRLGRVQQPEQEGGHEDIKKSSARTMRGLSDSALLTEEERNMLDAIAAAPAVEIQADDTTDSSFTTPALLTSYYEIDKTGTANTSQLVYAFNDYYYSDLDLAIFNSAYGTSGSVAYVPNGHEDDSVCYTDATEYKCYEPNLDIQYITAIGVNTPTYYYYDSSSASDFLSNWLPTVSSLNPLPSVLSISYGMYESDTDDDQRSSFDAQIKILAALGTTMVAGSGDDGVAGFDARTSSTACGYKPFWPSTHPYVLSVGATQGPEAGTTEIGCSASTGGVITSGGGFSNIYARPAWQTAHVSKYFTTVSTQPVSGYNTTGRAYPDVSILGRRYSVYVGGDITYQSGVSAATPVIAAMLGIINGHRVAAGRPLLGFITPYLYANSSLFANDITSGNNKCAGEGTTTTICCNQGFYAAAGWDPMTGLGSVNFFGLYDLIFNHGYVYTPRPSSKPTSKPTTKPTAPTAVPTPRPTAIPTTATPSTEPTRRPTSHAPTAAPTAGVNSKGTDNTVVIGAVLGSVAFIICLGGGYFVFSSGDKKGGSEGGSYQGGSDGGSDGGKGFGMGGFTPVNSGHDNDNDSDIVEDHNQHHHQHHQGFIDHVTNAIEDQISGIVHFFDPNARHGHHPHHSHHHSHNNMNSSFGNLHDVSNHSDDSADYYASFEPNVKEFEMSAGLNDHLAYAFSAEHCELNGHGHLQHGGGGADALASPREENSLAVSSVSASDEDSAHHHQQHNYHNHSHSNGHAIRALTEPSPGPSNPMLMNAQSHSDSGSGSGSDSGSGSGSESGSESGSGSGSDNDDEEEDYGEVLGNGGGGRPAHQ